MKQNYKEWKQNFQKISNLINYLWNAIQDSYNNEPIYIQTKENAQSFPPTEKIKKIIIPSTTIKKLIDRSLFNKTEMINIINSFDDIYARIEYPYIDYQEIIDGIVDIKKSEKFELKIEVKINNINTNERPFQHIKYIDSVIISDNNKFVLDSYFELCSSLSNILIPNSITKINQRSFYSCSKLTQIDIPPSVVTIEANAFMHTID